jgi:thiamine biosynthesis protein ThiS
VEVIANGRAVDLPEGSTVADLLDALGLARRTIVVERNGEPVERAAMTATVLAAGDRCELVRAVAGG